MRAKRNRLHSSKMLDIIATASDSLSRGEPVLAVVPVQIRVLAAPQDTEMYLAAFFICREIYDEL